MPTVQFREWRDFRAAGIEVLTGEACGLNIRLLCDLTEPGRKLFCKVFGLDLATNKLGEPWNRGSAASPHVASVMLARDQLPVLSVFAALEQPGVVECYTVYNKRGEWQGTYGFNNADRLQLAEWLKVIEGFDQSARRYAYEGTAGDRNTHAFSGRVS